MVWTEDDLFTLVSLKMIDNNPKKAIELMEEIQLTKEDRKDFCLFVKNKYRGFGKMPKEIEDYLTSKI